jgi:hypothetical protein
VGNGNWLVALDEYARRHPFRTGIIVGLIGGSIAAVDLTLRYTVLRGLTEGIIVAGGVTLLVAGVALLFGRGDRTRRATARVGEFADRQPWRYSALAGGFLTVFIAAIELVTGDTFVEAGLFGLAAGFIFFVARGAWGEVQRRRRRRSL